MIPIIYIDIIILRFDKDTLKIYSGYGPKLLIFKQK